MYKKILVVMDIFVIGDCVFDIVLQLVKISYLNLMLVYIFLEEV